MKLVYEVTLPPGDAKREDLPPIIFLHGRMDSKKTWRKFVPEIAKRTGREVYSLDARNHGDSPWSDVINFDVLTSDLDEFMEDHEIQKAILIGHSLGGRTVMNFSLKKPDAVEKLIVEDMDTKNYNPITRRTIQQIAHLLRSSLSAIVPGSDETTAKQAVVAFIKEKLPPSSSLKKESQLFDLDTIPIKKDGDSYTWQANMDVLEDMLTSDKNDHTLFGLYTGNALFLYGTESFFDVENDEDIYKHFPSASKVAVAGAGHLIHHDFPNIFLQHVVDFIVRPKPKMRC